MAAHPAAVVFDMDGTLLDTERLARICFARACRDVGWEPDMAVYDRCVGTTWEATERIIRQGFGRDFPYERMSDVWTEHYHAHVHHEPVDLKPGIIEVLERLSTLDIPMAVATSSRRQTVEAKLDLAGIDRYFEHLVCGGETASGKPAADPYLAALTALGAQSRSSWAIEDSDNGVRAAHAAGMTVFQIPDELAPHAAVLALGHAVLASAHELLVLLEPV